MIISTVNTKGGTAKSTTSIYLATTYSRLGKRAVVLDLDRQGSATDWADRATENDDPLPFPVHVTNMKRLSKYPGSSDYDVVLIDTPPGDSQVIDAAIAVSDFVILPTQATGLDTARVWETLPAVKDRVPYGVLITSARLNTNLLENAKAAFDDNGISRFDTVIPMRERIRTTFGWTPTHDDGYADVVKEIEEALA
ncbi:ParA family protein (plasmid) [Rhodococcus ruber]|jgi:chromosome partitioning protein|uniref:ParA family protein n=1 Tax=Rhodococcus ruber TaxID=1830 RepID=UPI00111F608C|nr:ParA family protein [Rhodococcus ruber]QDC17477.1 AAA family ATPase [Rhodococcus ruber]QRE83783.1 ParA family protein [Rhodococcus ruber]